MRVGLKLPILAGVALVVILIFYTTIQYGKSTERLRQLQEQIETLEETKERVNESITSTITLEPSDALEQLRNRQNQ